MKRHAQTHNDERPFNCEVCDWQFSESSHLKRLTTSTQVKNHSSVWFTTCKLQQNAISELTGSKPYRCGNCCKQFSQRGVLNIHVRVHTGERLYTCEVCTREFSESGSLKKHSWVHTKEKPYKCELCYKEFRMSSYLTRHYHVHTGQKQHKCAVC